MIKLENVSKTFGTGASAITDLSLGIESGEFVFLVGPSGSGKTTLFRLLIREMLPSEGSIVVDEWEITKLPNGKIPHLRKKIGVVFQDLKMLMDRTIFENIAMPLEMSGVNRKTAQERVEEILKQVGILEHKEKFPVQLSGGELQRAAIARALIFSPDILLADEPTGNLDAINSWEIVKLLQDINKVGTTVIMATHNMDIVNSLLKRIIVLDKGKLIKDEKRGSSSAKASHVAEAMRDKLADKEKKEEKDEKKKEEENSDKVEKGDKKENGKDK